MDKSGYLCLLTEHLCSVKLSNTVLDVFHYSSEHNDLTITRYLKIGNTTAHNTVLQVVHFKCKMTHDYSLFFSLKTQISKIINPTSVENVRAVIAAEFVPEGYLQKLYKHMTGTGIFPIHVPNIYYDAKAPGLHFPRVVLSEYAYMSSYKEITDTSNISNMSHDFRIKGKLIHPELLEIHYNEHQFPLFDVNLLRQIVDNLKEL